MELCTNHCKNRLPKGSKTWRPVGARSPGLVKLVIVIALTAYGCLPLTAAGGLTNPFFVLINGLGPQPLTGSPGPKVALAKKMGFDGLEFEGTQSIPEMLKALDEHGLKLFCQFFVVDVSGKQTVYQPGLEEAVRQLRGRDTLIWLAIGGNGPMAEQRAVEAARAVADMAAESGLRVALYPHFGFYVARPEDAVRIANEAGRGNLGVTFNLCHWLRGGGGESVQSILQQAMPRLWSVTINGADHQGDWDRLIQPLDRGDFDVEGFLKVLIGLGYRGPIGLQCHGIPGDAEENLRRSMRAWLEMSSRIAADKPHAKSQAKTSE